MGRVHEKVPELDIIRRQRDKLLAVVAGNADQLNTDFQSHSDTLQAHLGHSRNTFLNQTMVTSITWKRYAIST